MTLSSFKQSVRDFLYNTFEVTSTKRSKIIGAVIGVITLLAVVLSVHEFTSQDFSSKWLLLAVALICPFILFLTTAFTVRFKSDLFDKIWHLALLFLMPIVSITMTECLNDIFIYNMTYLGFLGNYIVILIMFFIVSQYPAR